MQPSKSPWGNNDGSLLWQPFNFTLAPGESTDGSSAAINVIAPGNTIPNFWLVSIAPVAGSVVNVYTGANRGGYRVQLGASGKVCLPADGPQIVVENVSGAATIRGVAIAIRGYPVSLDLDIGELA